MRIQAEMHFVVKKRSPCHTGATMKRLLPLVAVSSLFLLSACVDTTGISADSSRVSHPSTNPSAAVRVAEFADLQCPACKAAHTNVVQPILEKYGMRIRYDFVHFPLRTIHPNALTAAEASECAADQGKFWEFVDLNFANQNTLSADSVKQWAQQLGLDMDLFNRCLDSGIKRDGILAEYDQGKTAGVTGTPSFFVNGVRVESSVSALSEAIDAALAQPGQRL